MVEDYSRATACSCNCTADVAAAKRRGCKVARKTVICVTEMPTRQTDGKEICREEFHERDERPGMGSRIGLRKISCERGGRTEKVEKKKKKIEG